MMFCNRAPEQVLGPRSLRLLRLHRPPTKACEGRQNLCAQCAGSRTANCKLFHFEACFRLFQRLVSDRLPNRLDKLRRSSRTTRSRIWRGAGLAHCRRQDLSPSQKRIVDDYAPLWRDAHFSTEEAPAVLRDSDQACWHPLMWGDIEKAEIRYSPAHKSHC
jgi:hypothetical protein